MLICNDVIPLRCSKAISNALGTCALTRLTRDKYRSAICFDAQSPGLEKFAGAMNAVKVPATAQAILAARIDRLSAEEKEGTVQ
jgi:hypothetical protein